MARACHELGDVDRRNLHSTRFRRVSEYLEGGCVTWADLDVTSPNPISAISALSANPLPSEGAVSEVLSTSWQLGGGVCEANCSMTASPEVSRLHEDGGGPSPDVWRSGFLESPFTGNEPGAEPRRRQETKATSCPALAELLLMAESSEPTGDSGVDAYLATFGVRSKNRCGTAGTNLGMNVAVECVGVSSPALGTAANALYPLASVMGA
eukprot:TRINITY_DN328_c0_g4_i2.p1 TRINITY_DN328_c0_g4~~TRINITY_DN328_c0_g4_i2.p1  ORF type:complete len:210 (-),score=13.61 TRINITY_DN328_c0_g4_i2:178-807(-)